MTEPPNDRVALTVSHTLTITDPEGRPALELTVDGDDVTCAPLPKNSTRRRQPVKLADLKAAVDTIIEVQKR